LSILHHFHEFEVSIAVLIFYKSHNINMADKQEGPPTKRAKISSPSHTSKDGGNICYFLRLFRCLSCVNCM